MAVLGANIYVSTKWATPQPPPRDNERFLDLGTKVPYKTSSKSGIKLVFPSTVFPWLKQIQLKSGKVTDARLCDAQDESNLTKCITPTAINGFYPVDLTGDQGTQKALCLYDSEWYCKIFTVAQPFLTQGPWKGGAVPAPFVVDNGVAIFGVVDSSLAKLIGTTNLAYENVDKNFQTTVAFADELDSLDQAVQACNAEAACKAANKRVLLAQMPEQQAGALASSIYQSWLQKDNSNAKAFDVVLSEANIRGATPEQKITRDKSRQNERTLVFSPGAVYEIKDADYLHLRMHEVTLTTTGNDIVTNHTVIAKDRIPFPNPAEAARLTETWRINTKSYLSVQSVRKTIEAMVRERAAALDPKLNLGTSEQVVPNAVLAAMRFSAHADVAVTQQRDLFGVQNLAQSIHKTTDLPEIVDRLLWKGDLLVNVPVKGSVLTAMMEHSAEIAQQDAAPLNTDAEHDRSLLSLGITQDPGTKKWYVNGAEVDGDRLYGVAMPDFMLFGDTAYPELKKPDGISPFRLDGMKELRLLSSTVCRLLVVGSGNCHPSTIKSSILSDKIETLPSGRTTPVPLLQLTRNAILDGLKPHDPIPGDPSSSEKRVQTRRVISVTMEKMEGSYNLYMNNQPNEKTSESRFAGLTTPAAAIAPGSSNVSTNARLRARMAFGSGDLYVLGEENYVRDKVRAVDNAYVPTLKQNTWALESGWNQRIAHHNIQTPEFLTISSLRYEQQIEKPLVTLSIGGTPVMQSVQRSPSLLAKLGLRWQGKSSWFEAGFQGGRRLDLTSAFGIAPADSLKGVDPSLSATALKAIPGAFVCDITSVGVGTLANCIAANITNSFYQIVDPVTQKVTYRAAGFRTDTLSRPRAGNFLNFKIELPVPGVKNLSYVMENKGEFNYGWNHDLPVDTKIFDVWTNSLKIDLTKNLSLAPKLEYLYFKNKVNGTSITGLTSAISLQYRFEWRPTLPLGTVLRYPYPAAK